MACHSVRAVDCWETRPFSRQAFRATHVSIAHSGISPIMPHEVLVGSSCYTASSAQELKARANKTSQPQIKRIRGQWVYYVDLKSSDRTVLNHVKTLLQDVDSEPLLASESTENSITLYVTPRYLSPWSSQATSIAHVCGLKDQVRRIEKGRLIVIDFEEAYQDGQDATFKDILYDRMTEIFSIEKPELNVMFAESSPSPLVVVDIFAGGKEPLAILQAYNKEKGLSLDDSEMHYLVDVFKKLGRPPHDVELFMFAQVNSEYVLMPNKFHIVYHLTRLFRLSDIAATKSSTLAGPLMESSRTRACLT